MLVLAGSRGGKSTLAYRACRELGAEHMADDLALARARPDGVEVTGWPTRAGVPVEVLDPGLLDSMPGDLISHGAAADRPRSRVTLRPPEYERLLGIGQAGPALLGGIICLSPAPGGPAAASVMPPVQTSQAIAAAARIPVQRATMTDLLGLTGIPPVPAPGPVTGGQGMLPVDGIPAIAVGIPDMSLLPCLPVWDLIGGRIPGLEAAR